MLWLGGQAVAAGSLSVGDLVAFLALFARFTGRAFRIPQMANRVQAAAAAYTRLAPLLAAPATPAGEPPHASRRPDRVAGPPAPPAPPTLSGTSGPPPVSLCGVTFTYPGAAGPALAGISLEVPAGAWSRSPARSAPASPRLDGLPAARPPGVLRHDRGQHHPAVTGTDANPQRQLARLEADLHAAVAELEQVLADPNTEGLARLNEDGDLIVSPLAAEQVPAEADALAQAVAARLPQIHLPALLIEVDRDTRFSESFTHAGGAQSRNPDLVRNLYASVLAYACNLGYAGMADASGISEDTLAWTSQWYLRQDTLPAANARLVNAHHQHPLTRLWGGGTLSSSDEQRFPQRGRSLTARALSRYFLDEGTTTYTHVSDQHSTYGTKVIPTTWREAVAVLDEIFGNPTDLPIAEHTTDTAGQTLATFGIFDLAGLQFSHVSATSADCSSTASAPGPRGARRQHRLTGAVLDQHEAAAHQRRDAKQAQGERVAPAQGGGLRQGRGQRDQGDHREDLPGHIGARRWAARGLLNPGGDDGHRHRADAYCIGAGGRRYSRPRHTAGESTARRWSPRSRRAARQRRPTSGSSSGAGGPAAARRWLGAKPLSRLASGSPPMTRPPPVSANRTAPPGPPPLRSPERRP